MLGVNMTYQPIMKSELKRDLYFDADITRISSHKYRGLVKEGLDALADSSSLVQGEKVFRGKLAEIKSQSERDIQRGILTSEEAENIYALNDKVLIKELIWDAFKRNE